LHIHHISPILSFLLFTYYLLVRLFRFLKDLSLSFCFCFYTVFLFFFFPNAPMSRVEFPGPARNSRGDEA
jgi:hypothetical protein